MASFCTVIVVVACVVISVTAQGNLQPPPAPGRILVRPNKTLTAFELIEKANDDEDNLRILGNSRGRLFQGDIKLSHEQKKILGFHPRKASRANRRQKRAAMSSLSRRWVKSNGEPEIPYQIEGSVNHARGVILAGIRHWTQHVPCLKFVPRTRRHSNYVSFFSGGGCFSMVGRVGGGQKISIGRGCDRLHIVVHEIGHALGFWHEQARPDRDRYVNIYWTNIPQGFRSQFTKMPAGAVDSRGIAYDYDSVMHYHSTAFGGGRVTITRKPSGSRKLGNTQGLSPKDIQQANLMYCKRLPTKKPATAKPPTGCQHKDNNKNCPLWAKYGYCDGKWQDYMSNNCRASCLCTSNNSCTNKMQDWKCEAWRGDGYCRGIYEDFMSTFCRKSCGRC